MSVGRGNPNLNLVVDSFHLIARADSPEDLMDIPASRIGRVQLSVVAMSAFPALEDQIDIARHYRLYPGEGSHGGEIHDLVRFFRDTGYAGDYVFDVYNDKYLALSPAEAGKGSVVVGRARPEPGHQFLLYFRRYGVVVAELEAVAALASGHRLER